MKTVTKLGIAVSLFGAIISQPSLAQVGGLGGIRGNVGQSIGSNLNKNRSGQTIARSHVCRDLSVTEVAFGRYGRRAIITVIVKNKGPGEFVSSEGQQAVRLSEIYPGRRNREVAIKEFERLRPGQTVTLIYARDWNTSSLTGVRNPVSYDAEITYDPDIYIDGNNLNDDCNLRNNILKKSTAAIDRLFR